jgi:hypothetical protein
MNEYVDTPALEEFDTEWLAANEQDGMLRIRVIYGLFALTRLRRGADPHLRDPVEQRTALEWCRHARTQLGDQEASRSHAEVEALLIAATRTE